MPPEIIEIILSFLDDVDAQPSKFVWKWFRRRCPENYAIEVERRLHFDLIEWCYNNGCDIDGVGDVLIAHNRLEILEWLAAINLLPEYLHKSAYKSVSPYVLEWLHEHGVKLRSSDYGYITKFGRLDLLVLMADFLRYNTRGIPATILLTAADYGNVEIVKWVLATFRGMDTHKSTALSKAYRSGNLHLVRMLSKSVNQLLVRDMDHALQGGYLKCIKHAIENGAKVDKYHLSMLIDYRDESIASNPEDCVIITKRFNKSYDYLVSKIDSHITKHSNGGPGVRTLQTIPLQE